MSSRSEDKDSKTWFRTDRFFQIGSQWFFMTREGEQLGPFDNRQEAETELMLYLRKLEEMKKFGGDTKPDA